MTFDVGSPLSAQINTMSIPVIRHLLKCSKQYCCLLPNAAALSRVCAHTSASRLCIDQFTPTHLHKPTLWFTRVHAQAAFSTAVVNGEELDAKSSRKKFVRRNTIRQDRAEFNSYFEEMKMAKGDEAWTEDDWAKLAAYLPANQQDMWDVVCMHQLYTDRNLTLARSLMLHLEKDGKLVNTIALTFFIGLLGETTSGFQDQEDETQKYYQQLLTRTDILDAVSVEVLISALAKTRHYLECLRLLKISAETNKNNVGSLVEILLAGLQNKDDALCKSMLAEIEENTEITSLTSFVPRVIKACLQAQNQRGLDMTMSFLQRHRILIPPNLLDEISEIFERFQPNQWTAQYGKIHHLSGRCSICNNQMAKLEVSDADFLAVQSAFLDQVIVGKNIFFKSSPEEVQSFLKFVLKKGPFDVVVDGLNVLFNADKWNRTNCLRSLVQHFSQQGKKVLLLGNQMLIKHIRELTVSPQPDSFITSTTKADDVFFLYAALHSGKNTLIITADKLRDHKFLLSPSLRPTFNQWLLSAQINQYFFTKKHTFVLGKRVLFDVGPTKHSAGWHFPEMDVNQAAPFGNLSVLCMLDKSLQVRERSSREDSQSPPPEHTKSHASDSTDQKQSTILAVSSRIDNHPSREATKKSLPKKVITKGETLTKKF